MSYVKVKYNTSASGNQQQFRNWNKALKYKANELTEAKSLKVCPKFYNVTYISMATFKRHSYKFRARKSIRVWIRL